MAVKTLYVAGLPQDTLERELYLVFRRSPGYQKSMLVRKDPTKRPFGFVLFSNASEAEEAVRSYDGYVFDPSCETRIKVEISKKDMPYSLHHDRSPPAVIKTIHITGLPRSVTADIVEAMILGNFQGHVSGIKFHNKEDGGRPFAFVGFYNARQAKRAIDRLNCYQWAHNGEHAKLKATLAHTEYNVITSKQLIVLPAALGGVKGSKRTVHFSGIPGGVTEEDFTMFLEGRVGGVEAVKLTPGSRPYAFALFESEAAAARAVEELHGTTYRGEALVAQLARSEFNR